MSVDGPGRGLCRCLGRQARTAPLALLGPRVATAGACQVEAAMFPRETLVVVLGLGHQHAKLVNLKLFRATLLRFPSGSIGTGWGGNRHRWEVWKMTGV